MIKGLLTPNPLSLLAATVPALAGEAFDWDRYHDRQDACREARRTCSAFTGEHR